MYIIDTSCQSDRSLHYTRNVFKRSLDEITMEALDTILELINSNTLYKGEESLNCPLTSSLERLLLFTNLLGIHTLSVLSAKFSL